MTPTHPLRLARKLGVCRLCGKEPTEEEMSDPELFECRMGNGIESGEFAHRDCLDRYFRHIRKIIPAPPQMKWRRD